MLPPKERPLGELRRSNGADVRRLLNQHLVGRGPECALRLQDKNVSSQHALVRWQGGAWEVVDRGSLNGTQLDGERLEPGRPTRLKKGAVLTFGHRDECWVLADASGPEVMAIALDDGSVSPGAQGLIGLPPGDEPELTLYRDRDGVWRAETAEGGDRLLADGETLTAGGRDFRFCLPNAAEATAAAGSNSALEEPVLHFAVSLSEEFVELKLEANQRVVSLGSRAHNYLLLTLARRELADAQAGLPAAECGWMDKDELADGLRMTPQQIDGEVFRIRKHFASKGLSLSADIVERRPRTKQIRLGVRKVSIERG
jgi:hypothetical protein